VAGGNGLLDGVESGESFVDLGGQPLEMTVEGSRAHGDEKRFDVDAGEVSRRVCRRVDEGCGEVRSYRSDGRRCPGLLGFGHGSQSCASNIAS
jgi:hypothetical protein